jgi:hypothetical protein
MNARKQGWLEIELAPLLLADRPEDLGNVSNTQAPDPERGHRSRTHRSHRNGKFQYVSRQRNGQPALADRSDSHPGPDCLQRHRWLLGSNPTSNRN